MRRHCISLFLLLLCWVVVTAGECTDLIFGPADPLGEYVVLECEPYGGIDFGDIVVGSVREASFVIRNPAKWETGTELKSLTPEDGPYNTVSVTGFTGCDLAGAPATVEGPLPVTLEDYESAELTLRFAPTALGTGHQCTLVPTWDVVYSKNERNPQRSICRLSVRADVLPGPEPSCTVQPGSDFDFDVVEVGRAKELILTIRNQTTDLVEPNQFKYVLENPVGDCGMFTIDPADTARVIGPGESWDIVARFAPDAAQSFACTRSLASLKEPADPADPYITNACPTTVTWRGTGVIGAPVWNSCAPGGTNDWHGVSGVSGSEIYVAGNGGSVIASGGDCQWVASGTVFSDVNLRDIWAYSDGASTVAWAVGNIPPPPGTFGETGAVLRMDGALWYKVDEGIFVTYGAVWGSAFDDVYFVGTGIATDFPDAKHWNGSAFDTLHISPMGMSEVSGVSGNAANDIWAVLRQQTFSVYHYDGSEWTNETQPWMNKPLHDVWTVAGTGFYHAYAVGEDGAIYHFDGTHWTDESIPGETRDFHGVWVSQTGQVFVVGEGSVIYHSDGNNNWTQQTPSNVQGDLMDVWGASDSDVYAVGTNGLILRYAPPGP